MKLTGFWEYYNPITGKGSAAPGFNYATNLSGLLDEVM